MSAPSLDDLIVLNDEILALTRAGVPIEPGLAQLASDLPPGSGDLASQWAARLSQGARLDEVVGGDSGLPAVYRAVLAAGQRSGKLSAALEGMASTARQVQELRQLVGVALLYPLLVLIFAYVALLFFAAIILPIMADFYQTPQGPSMSESGFGWLFALARGLEMLSFWPVVAVVVIALAWWMLSGRAAAMQPGWIDFWLGWLPGFGGLLHASRLASFTSVLELLVAQRVPLPEAITLAGEAVGDPKLQADAQTTAARLRRGESGGDGAPGLSPLLNWLLLGAGEVDLLRALKYAAAQYRQQAIDRAQWLRLYLPVILLLAIGATAVAVYALVALGPWYTIMTRLGLERHA